MYIYIYNTYMHTYIHIHMETSHLICTADQMTGFYMKYNNGLNGLKCCFKKVKSLTVLLEK